MLLDLSDRLLESLFFWIDNMMSFFIGHSLLIKINTKSNTKHTDDNPHHEHEYRSVTDQIVVSWAVMSLSALDLLEIWRDHRVNGGSVSFKFMEVWCENDMNTLSPA